MYRQQKQQTDRIRTEHQSFRPTEHTKREYKTRRVPEKQLVFGLHAVMEAIDAGKEFDKILLRRDMSSDLARQLQKKLADIPTPIQKVPVEKLNQITDKNHQGVIAYISPIQFAKIDNIIPTVYEEGRQPVIVVLDGITDVRNFGAIARTCSCAGVDAILTSSHGVASINADAIKTSAGALHTLPVCRAENLSEAVKYLKNSGLQIVAATEHATIDYTNVDYNSPTAIVMGSEDIGISNEILELCDHQVAIPMVGTIESLNVSVAAGVMIYEIVKQRRK